MENAQRVPDARVMLLLMANRLDGDIKKVSSGAWLHYLIKPDCLVSAYHVFADKEICTGEKGEANIIFLVPNIVKGLTVGQQIPVFEGAREVGLARVLEIFNLDIQS
jgi:hypothetical protein